MNVRVLTKEQWWAERKAKRNHEPILKEDAPVHTPKQEEAKPKRKPRAKAKAKQEEVE